MPAPDDQPTLLLVHGAWCGGWMWEPTAQLLREQGRSVVVVDRLPSTGTDPAVLDTLTEDAAHVGRVLDTLDGPAVLCGHSYGGMVITELAQHPGVVHSVYLSAFWPRAGESLISILGDGPPPDWQVIRDDGAIAITDDEVRATDALFADLPETAAQSAYAQLVLQSLPSFLTPSSGAAHAHPTTYVVCTEDRAIPPAAQDAMAASADAVLRLDSAHCPQLSHPAAVARILADVAAAPAPQDAA